MFLKIVRFFLVMLKYDELKFEEVDGNVKIVVYDFFYKVFSKDELEREIGEFKMVGGNIQIGNLDKSRCEKKVMRFFRKYKGDLNYSINKKKVIYVDEDLGLPLVGLNFIGIVDKGSEILEIKPITGCNADCNFCSVGEGLSSMKKRDFVVDKDYLVKETINLLEFKKVEGMSIWINPHGEPTLYSKLVEYCDEVLDSGYVKDVHIITNGVLFGKKIVDELFAISKKRGKEVNVSFSISSLENEGEIMGRMFNAGLVIKNIEYAIKKLKVILTPVWIYGINDEEIKKLVKFAENKKIKISIQKFCKNKYGRNPIKEISWEKFFKDLKDLESEMGVKLTQPLTKLKQTKQLPLLCKKGDQIEVERICRGKGDEILGVLNQGNQNRAVVLFGCSSLKKKIKGKVLKNKYNITVAKCI